MTDELTMILQICNILQRTVQYYIIGEYDGQFGTSDNRVDVDT